MPSKNPRTRAFLLERQVSDDLAHLGDVPRDVARLLAEHRSTVNAIQQNGDLTPRAKARLVQDSQTAAADEIRDLTEGTQGAHEALTRNTTTALTVEHGDTHEQLLSEMKLQRAWARTKELLDSGRATVPEVITNAAAAGDSATFDALRAELAHYQRASGAPDGSIKAAHELLAQQEEPLLAPDKKLARQTEREAEQRRYFAGMALAQAREELGGGAPQPHVAASHDELLPVV